MDTGKKPKDLRLQDFEEKYPKEVILKNFLSYISDETYALQKNTLLFRTVTAKENNLPRAFVDKYIDFYVREGLSEDERAFREYQIFNNVIRRSYLDDRLIEQYGDKIDWKTISGRPDLNLPFAEKHLSKLKLSDIRADLGKEFIKEHFDKLNPIHLVRMKLTKDQVVELIKTRKTHIFQHTHHRFFDFDFLIENINFAKTDEIAGTILKIGLSYGQVIKILELLKDRGSESKEWNYLISRCLKIEGLSLYQQKNIKFYSELIY